MPRLAELHHKYSSQCRSGRSVGAVVGSGGRSGGGLAFLRHKCDNTPTAFLKTGNGCTHSPIGAV